MSTVIRTIAALLVLTAPAPASATNWIAKLDRGEIIVYSRIVKNSSTQEVVVKAVLEAAPVKVWRLVSRCNDFTWTMPRIKKSRQISRKGNRIVCTTTVDMPFPYKDLTATIVLQPNNESDVVDGRVRTALARLFGTFTLGRAVRQSDVIRAIDEVLGVEYVVTPLTKMVRGDSAQVVREIISTDTDSDFEHITDWSSPTVNVYLLKNALDSATINAGGESKEFRGVFEDEVRLIHHEVAPNINGFPIRGSVGGAFIIGDDGLVIPGLSDDATIEANFVLPSNPDEKAADILRIRKLLTANRVLVSYLPGGDIEDNPKLHDYTVTYVVTGDEGVKNIDPGPIEYLVIGELNFVYDEVT